MNFLVPVFVFAAFTMSAFGHEPQNHASITQEMHNAATTFLASLDDSLRKDAIFEFQDAERENWHYIPMDREGVLFTDLKAHQRHLAFGLLGTGLTQKGLLTSTQIMMLEEILRSRNDHPTLRDTEKYFITIFGTPSLTQPWGWRFEGHHLSLNFTVLGPEITGFPAFFGTNPAELKKGPMKGLRPLGALEDAARQLANHLAQAGLSPVFSKKAPREILTAADHTALTQEVAGITSDRLSEAQIKQLLAIIDEASSMLREKITHRRLHQIQTTQGKKMHFAWAGSLEKGKAHYFRIQGSDFLIEYANTQNNANHAHLSWRDLKNDFARDSLKEHYLKQHQ